MRKAYLLLEDSSILEGFCFGSPREAEGEVVFTTGMVGYPESLTDPSYKCQIVVFTYPLQGNYGVPNKKNNPQRIEDYFESHRIHASGMVASSYIDTYSHWNAYQSLDKWLRKEKIPALFGIDTRAITKKLRKKGVMLGKISHSRKFPKVWHDPNEENLVSKVSVNKPIIYGTGSKTIIVVDCGVKYGILKQFLEFGVRIIRVPWDFDLSIYKKLYDAVVISNGPGDPAVVGKTRVIAEYCLSNDIPLLGICIGHQILALAAGGKTYKLTFGHRSHNQSCFDKFTKKAYMTTQNHGFAVDRNSLPRGWQEWFVNLNDDTNEGIRHRNKPFWSVQFHPEGRPGPYDTNWIFKDFLKEVDRK